MRSAVGWAWLTMLLAAGAVAGCGGGGALAPAPTDPDDGGVPPGDPLAVRDTVALQCSFMGNRTLRLPSLSGSAGRGAWSSLDTTIVRVVDGEVAIAVRPGRAVVRSSVSGASAILVVVGDVVPRAFVIAHRGFGTRYPENTVEAFERAIADGADAIEFDIHLSADGTPVVIHDQALDRTTTGTGRVRDARDAYLRTLNACPRSALGPCRLPTLADVLDVLLRHPGTRGILDLKTPLSATQVNAVLGPVVELGLADRLMLMTSDTTVLARAATAQPLVPLGYLFFGSEAVPSLEQQARDGRAAVRPLRWWLDVAPPTLAEELRERCVEPIGWTANSATDADQLIQRGIFGIIANVPLVLSARS